MFEFWDWVGGRYSSWLSDWPVDLFSSSALITSLNCFLAHICDGQAFAHHACREKPARTAGAIGIWYNNFFARKLGGSAA
ncbi:hypothetical protein ACLK1S_25100 [Escherichia coli]